MTTATKARPGRKPLPEGEHLVQRSIRMHPDDWARIDASGGLPWLRRVIRRSRVKPMPLAAGAKATA